MDGYLGPTPAAWCPAYTRSALAAGPRPAVDPLPSRVHVVLPRLHKLGDFGIVPLHRNKFWSSFAGNTCKGRSLQKFRKALAAGPHCLSTSQRTWRYRYCATPSCPAIMFGACEQATPAKGSTYYGDQTLTTGIVVEIHSILKKGGYTA